MVRIGEIARLPQELRKQLNPRMADGEPGGPLLRWLNGLPAGRDQAESQGESKQVQVKNFHRGDEPCRLGHGTPREYEEGKAAADRVGMSCGADRSHSILGGLAALRDESEIFGAGQGGSNLVQPIFFSGALRNGVQTSAEGVEDSGSAGSLSNIIYAAAGTSRCDVRAAERSVRRRNPVSGVRWPSTDSAR